MKNIWETLESAFPKITGYLREAEKDLPEHPVEGVEGWQGLMDFSLFENQAINGEIVTENLSRRAYMNPVTIDANFTSLADAGFVEKRPDGTFTISNIGSAIYMDYFLARMLAYSSVTVLPDDDFILFSNFLEKGYEAGKVAEKPAYKPSMTLGYKFYTNITGIGGQLGTLLGWINLFELYRDDVHAYVWKKAGYTGIQIEALSKIWRDEAHNASELAEQLAFRGYSDRAYQNTLDELVTQGKLEIIDNQYKLTADALKQRQQIEEETNRIFDDFCHSTYSEEELADLERIIKQIKA